MKTDYIREAVELADGWSVQGESVADHAGWPAIEAADRYSCPLANLSQTILDALAAQLERQLMQIEDVWIVIDGGIGEVRVEKLGLAGAEITVLSRCDYDDGYSLIGAECRITAIVESGVLKATAPPQ